MLHVQKWTNRRTDSTTTIWVWLSCNFIVDLFEIICLIIQSERSRNESWLVFFLCASYQMSNWTIDYNKFAAKYATLKCKQTYETMTTDTLIDFTTCANVYRFIGSTSFLVANRHNSCTSRKHHHCQKTPFNGIYPSKYLIDLCSFHWNKSSKKLNENIAWCLNIKLKNPLNIFNFSKFHQN